MASAKGSAWSCDGGLAQRSANRYRTPCSVPLPTSGGPILVARSFIGSATAMSTMIWMMAVVDTFPKQGADRNFRATIKQR